MTYDNELKCRACGSIGLNELEQEEVVEDGVITILKVVICECGEVVKEVDL